MISDIEEFFQQGCGRCDRFATNDCSVQQWSHGLEQLRQLCLDAGLVETVKWVYLCRQKYRLIGCFSGRLSPQLFQRGSA